MKKLLILLLLFSMPACDYYSEIEYRNAKRKSLKLKLGMTTNEVVKILGQPDYDQGSWYFYHYHPKQSVGVTELGIKFSKNSGDKRVESVIREWSP